jgi:hypothetical protein
MTLVQADFNNVTDQGLLALSMRRAPALVVGQRISVQDPGEEQIYSAVVASVTDRVAHLTVDWEPVALAAPSRVTVMSTRTSLVPCTFGTPDLNVKLSVTHFTQWVQSRTPVGAS